MWSNSRAALIENKKGPCIVPASGPDQEHAEQKVVHAFENLYCFWINNYCRVRFITSVWSP